MVEVFHAWGCIGNGLVGLTTGPEFSIHGCSSWLSSEAPSCTDGPVSDHKLDPGRLIRIRGESLRCLYMVLRASPDDVCGQWLFLLRNSPSRTGLLTIAQEDAGMYPRRFALSSMVALLRADRIRKWVGTLPPAHVSHHEHSLSLAEDIRTSIDLMIPVMSSFLESSREGDRESATFLVAEFVGSVPWGSLSEKEHHVDRLYGAVTQCAHDAELDGVTQLLSAIAVLIPLKALAITDVSELVNILNRVAEEVSALPWSDASRRCSLSASWAINKLLKYDVRSLHGRLIQFGLQAAHEILNSIGTCIKMHSVLPQLSASLSNSALLSNFNAEVGETLVDLAGNMKAYPREVADSFMVGLGRATRQSEEAARLVLSFGVNAGRRSAKQIQCIGDTCFSGILFGIKEPSLISHAQCLVELLRDQSMEAAALRAIMTGLVRLNEGPAVAGGHFLTTEILCSLQSWLLEYWEKPVERRDDRVMADSLRVVGLMQPLLYLLQIETLEFHTSSRMQLRDGLTSGKTQLVLGSLASLDQLEMASAEFNHFDSVLLQVFADSCTSIVHRERWDYSAAAPVGGALHVLVNASKFTERHVRSDVMHHVTATIVPLLDDRNILRLSKFNPAITDYIQEIKQLLSAHYEAPPNSLSEVHSPVR